MLLMLQPHIVHYAINSPQKHHPLFFGELLPLNLQTIQGPFFRQFPPFISFLQPPFPKIGFFSEPP